MLSSYATYDQLTEYATSKGADLASDDTTVQTAALVRASLALDYAYEARYPGVRASNTQTLGWPRTGAEYQDGTAIDGVPIQIVMATCELAIAELSNPGVLTPTVTPGKVKTRARVEGAVDVSYGRGGDLVQSMVPVNTTVEALLFSILGPRSALPGILVV